jgi:hypothetical protein
MQDREHHRAAEMVAEQSFVTKSCSSRLQDMVAVQGCSTGCRSRVFSKELQLKVTVPGCSKEGCRTRNTIRLYKMVAGQEFLAKSCSSRLQDMVATQGWSIDCSTYVCRTGNTTGLQKWLQNKALQQRVAAQGYRTWLQCRVAAQLAARRDSEQGTSQGCIKWL